MPLCGSARTHVGHPALQGRGLRCVGARSRGAKESRRRGAEGSRSPGVQEPRSPGGEEPRSVGTSAPRSRRAEAPRRAEAFRCPRAVMWRSANPRQSPKRRGLRASGPRSRGAEAARRQGVGALRPRSQGADDRWLCLMVVARQLSVARARAVARSVAFVIMLWGPHWRPWARPEVCALRPRRQAPEAAWWRTGLLPQMLATRGMPAEHQWSSGRIHRCHRCDPCSIPG